MPTGGADRKLLATLLPVENSAVLNWQQSSKQFGVVCFDGLDVLSEQGAAPSPGPRWGFCPIRLECIKHLQARNIRRVWTAYVTQ